MAELRSQQCNPVTRSRDELRGGNHEGSLEGLALDHLEVLYMLSMEPDSILITSPCSLLDSTGSRRGKGKTKTSNVQPGAALC